MNTTPSQPSSPFSGSSLATGPGGIPRRGVEIPGQRRPAMPEAAPVAAEMRKLIVGRDISLSGEIGACDVLVVEGTVEARLRDGRVIEIADTGLFKGSVEIDEADIAGRFEGDITVRGTLRVKGTGRIQGTIRYGVLEVEQGGQLSGTIEVLPAKPVPVTLAPEPEVEITPAAEAAAE